MAARSSRRGGGGHADYTWPGYVDALASLLMVFVFLIAFYTVGQIALGSAVSDRDDAIDRLNRQLSALGDVLNLERGKSEALDRRVGALSTQLGETATARDRALADLRAAEDRVAGFVRERDDAAARATAALAERDRLALQLAALVAERERLSGRLKQVEDRAAASALDADKLAAAMKAEIERQKLELTRLSASMAAANNERGKLFDDLTEEQKLTAEQKAAVIRLTREMDALRQDLARLGKLLDAADDKAKAQQAQIVDLGTRLNRALASKVEELSRYRSEFFGRVREALAGRGDVTIVGDRFVFQSEVLFDSAEAILKPEGQRQLAEFATKLRDIAQRMPADLDWVLQVEGHTDNQPIRTAQFPSNWELSAARAIAVVRGLVAEGMDPNRLVAAGHAEFRPLAAGNDPATRARNRRIELKITSR